MRAHAETYAASGSDRVGFSRGQQHGAEKETLCSLHVLCIAFKFMLHKEEEGVPDLYENCRTSFLKSHMQPIFKRAKKDKTHLRCHDAEHFVYPVHLLMSWRCVCIYVCACVQLHVTPKSSAEIYLNLFERVQKLLTEQCAPSHTRGAECTKRCIQPKHTLNLTLARYKPVLKVSRQHM